MTCLSSVLKARFRGEDAGTCVSPSKPGHVAVTGVTTQENFLGVFRRVDLFEGLGHEEKDVILR